MLGTSSPMSVAAAAASVLDELAALVSAAAPAPCSGAAVGAAVAGSSASLHQHVIPEPVAAFCEPSSSGMLGLGTSAELHGMQPILLLLLLLNKLGQVFHASTMFVPLLQAAAMQAEPKEASPLMAKLQYSSQLTGPSLKRVRTMPAPQSPLVVVVEVAVDPIVVVVVVVVVVVAVAVVM